VVHSYRGGFNLYSTARHAAYEITRLFVKGSVGVAARKPPVGFL